MLTLNFSLAHAVTAIVRAARKDGLKESVVRRVLTQLSSAHSEQAAHIMSRTNTARNQPVLVETAAHWRALRIDDAFVLAPTLQICCQSGCSLPRHPSPIRALRPVSQVFSPDGTLISETLEPTFLCPACLSALEIFDHAQNQVLPGSQMLPASQS